MRKLSYILTLIILILIIGCGKDIEGPNSLPPGLLIPPDTNDTIIPESPYGSLNIYLAWKLTGCQSIPVLVNDMHRGDLSLYFSSEPTCGETGTIMLDSLLPGPHSIYVGKCGIIYSEMNITVVKGECILVAIEN